MIKKNETKMSTKPITYLKGKNFVYEKFERTAFAQYFYDS